MIPSSVFFLEKFFPHKARRLLSFILTVSVIALLTLLFVVYVMSGESIFFYNLAGIIFMLSALRLYVFGLDAYFHAYYFECPRTMFEYYKLLYFSEKSGTSPLELFLKSSHGSFVMRRAGIGTEEMQAFLKSHEVISDGRFSSKEGEDASLSLFSKTLYREDKGFADFLFKHGIQESELVTIVSWLERALEEEKFNEWWWHRDNLRKIRGVGKDWAYAQTWKLDKYGHNLTNDSSIIKTARAYFRREKAVSGMENALSKAKESNVLLVGPPGVGKMHAVKYLAYKVATGDVPPQLRFKRMVTFNALFLISGKKTKGDFENDFINILREAERAGNIILVIDDFPEAVWSAEGIGTDIGSLLEDFLSSPRMHVVALASLYEYQQALEPNRNLMSFFEIVSMEETSEEETMLVMEEAVPSYESQYNVFYSYQALQEIVRGARRYFTDGVLPDKALDLLREVTSWAQTARLSFVTHLEIQKFLGDKTQIPMGEIKKEEQDKLLHLEDFLHKRVIGQYEAIQVIADALRRARADVRRTERPTGAFLFLGPTGVGKTETAKALAQVFFGGEEHMLRLDMSEFQEGDSIERLIGSFRTGKPGILANLLRAHPYGVLLLDEFEKSNQDVHDLFLQIFDEGFFSDMQGRRVNARNIILIATSNAGSDLIFQKITEGANTSALKEEIIDALIKQRIFKPELINRFDAVVLYHPLGQEHIEKIAILLLNELSKRMLERNIHLVITSDLVNTATQFGYDPRFGAREMRRAVTEKIENVIAQKIIKGEIREGQDLVLTSADVQ